MSKSAVSYGKRAANRLRSIRRAWKRRARRAMTLALVTAQMAVGPSWAQAQMGQMGMAPTGGIVNQAMSGIRGGPGWLYYGINAADRGLGYNGSYMTLGGFIPYAEDDLGGFWAADLRGHLSEYGGFFSNTGIVRKQFLGGTILGVGVYWDYDGDQNQYPVMGEEGALWGQFGHIYQQLTISGEWLTDFGNLRSNGYIPVGTTAYVAGAPGTPFYQNYLMCSPGLDAALTGADLEVGVYVPALADWAGMISVGGYALGNSRYDYAVGPQVGQDVVPYFGGVYTRLDLTIAKHVDVSLQYNNDSYFDSTGFVRLTYRMGGSRRRNVPDQMEQPMMRPEHIIRAHQTPIVALNPFTGDPWRLFHVNNAARPFGNGTAEAPFTTIAAANAAATNPWDIVLVARGMSSVDLNPASPNYGNVTNPYDGTFSPLAANQYFIGRGATFLVPTLNCEPIDIGGSGGLRPVLSNPTGASINLSEGLWAENFYIVNSAVGISGSGTMSGIGGRASVARAIDIFRTDPAATGIGIGCFGATGDALFRDVNIGRIVTLPDGTRENWTMTDGSVVVDGGSPNVDFAAGTIFNTESTLLHVNGTLGGLVRLTANPGQPFSDEGDGFLVENSFGDVIVGSTVPGMVSTMIASLADGIKVVNSSGFQTFDDVQITAAGGAGFAGVKVQNSSGTITFNNLDINLNTPANASPGFLINGANVVNVTGDSNAVVQGAPAISWTNVADAAATFNQILSNNSPTNGLLLDNVTGVFTVGSSLTVTNALQDAVVIRNSPNLTFTSPLTNASSIQGDGVVLQNNAVDASRARLGTLTVNTTVGDGLVVNQAGASTTGGTINAGGGGSIVANQADLDLTLATAASTNSAGPGLEVTQASGQVAIATTTVLNPTNNGINAVDNAPGFQANFGQTVVSGIVNGQIAVNLANAVEPVPPTEYAFVTLAISTNNGTGLRTSNAGVVDFLAAPTIQVIGGTAIDLENTIGTTGGVPGSGFTFQNLTSQNSPGSGVRLNNLNSDLRVLGTTNISNAAGPSLLITDTVGPPQTDSISFNQVNITNRNNIGLLVAGVFGQVQLTNLIIDNGNAVPGDAVLIRDTTNAADPIGTGSGRVYINGGTINASNGNGIQVQNALASITNMGITSSLANGIIATASAGEQTTIDVNTSAITSTVGLDGVRLQASGGGIVNGTIFASQLDAIGDPIDAVVLDAGSFISLNASGNFGALGPPGAGNFVLDNAGTLQIDQASLPDLVITNNNATVAVPNLPVSFNGSTPPVPPPSP